MTVQQKEARVLTLLKNMDQLATEAIELDAEYVTFHAVVQLKFAINAQRIALSKRIQQGKSCPIKGQDA